MSSPIIAVDDIVVGEGTGLASFLFRLSAPSSGTVSVNYTTSAGTAASNSDYISPGLQTVTFAPGETTRTVSVTVTDNAIAEPTESFSLNLSNPTGATLARSQVLATVIDNDLADRPPLVSVRDTSVDEAAGFARFYILLDRAAASAVTVTYQTAAGSATGADYTGGSGSLTFAPGEVAKWIDVAVTNDATSEGPETFDLILSGVSGGGAALADARATATIGASDAVPTALPTLIVDDIVVGEGTGLASFLFRLSAPSSGTVSVNYTTSAGTAASNSDYINPGLQTVTFAPGETTRTVSVTVTDNAIAEPTESFSLNLSNPTGATLARSQVLATVIDNDATRISIAALTPAQVERNGGQTPFSFIVYRSGDLSNAGTVDWDVVGDGARQANRKDFVGKQFPSGTVVFASGQSEATITIAVKGDGVAERDEGFAVVLSNASAGTVVENATARSTIVNDDIAVAMRLETDLLIG